MNLDFTFLVRSEYDENGYPTTQVDTFTDVGEGSQSLELHFPWGSFGMPHDAGVDASGTPIAEQAVKGWYGWMNDIGYAMPLFDPRLLPKLPQGKGGTYGIFGGRIEQPSFSYFDGASGSYQLYVPYGFSNGVPTKACSVAVNVRSDGAESIEIVHGSGMSFTIAAGGKNPIVIKNKAGDCQFIVDDDGVTVNGALKVNGGLIAGDATTALPLALAPALVSFLTTLVAAIGTALAAVVPGGPAGAASFTGTMASALPQLALVPATLTKGF